MHSLHYRIADDVRKEILHDFPSCHLLNRDFELNHHSQLYPHKKMTSYFCHCCLAHARMYFYYCSHDVNDDDEVDRYDYNDEAVADVLVDPQLSMGNFVSDISHL